jgi:hypothetical protein
MPKRFRFRPIGLVTAILTAGAMAAVAAIAPAGSGAQGAEKEYTAHFEPECVLAPGVLNIKAKIKVSTKAKGPASVSPGEEFTLTEASSTITTPVEWTESFYALGAREARGFVETFLLTGSGAEPTEINAAKPPEFPSGLPYKTPVEKGKELTFTAPSEGRTFKIGPLKVTGSAGESAKLTVNSEPAFEETAPGAYKATGKGIVSSTEGYNEAGTRVVGPLSVVCTAPAGVVLGEIPITSATSSSSASSSTSAVTTASTGSTASTSSSASTTSTAPTTSTTTTAVPTSTTTTTVPTTTTTAVPTSTTTTTVPTSTTTTVPTSTTTTTTSSTAEAPVVESVVPGHGPTFGFTPVLIDGKNLTANGEACIFFNLEPCGTSVRFGENEATFVLFASPEDLLVLSPPAAKPGRVDVRVTVNGMTSAVNPKDHFVYLGIHFGHGHGHGDHGDEEGMEGGEEGGETSDHHHHHHDHGHHGDR